MGSDAGSKFCLANFGLQHQQQQHIVRTSTTHATSTYKVPAPTATAYIHLQHTQYMQTHSEQTQQQHTSTTHAIYANTQ